MLVTGLGPILAPVVGGQLLALTSWEGIFLLLTVLSGLLALLVVVALPETLPAERRSHGGLARTVQTMGGLLRDRAFLGYALAGGLDVRRAVRLHLGLVVRAPADLRPVAAARSASPSR